MPGYAPVISMCLELIEIKLFFNDNLRLDLFLPWSYCKLQELDSLQSSWQPLWFLNSLGAQDYYLSDLGHSWSCFITPQRAKGSPPLRSCLPRLETAPSRACKSIAGPDSEPLELSLQLRLFLTHNRIQKPHRDRKGHVWSQCLYLFWAIGK